MLLMFCINHFQPVSVLLPKNEQKTGKRTAFWSFTKNEKSGRKCSYNVFVQLLLRWKSDKNYIF